MSEPQIGDIVTVLTDDPRKPGGVGVVAGELVLATEHMVQVRADRSSIAIARSKVLQIKHRDPSWPMFT